MSDDPPDLGGKLKWTRQRFYVVVRSFVVATVLALIVGRVVPPSAADATMICVVWISFYPVARLNPKAPWWLHWVRGAFIFVGYLVAVRLFR
jgi:hypothetical protein